MLWLLCFCLQRLYMTLSYKKIWFNHVSAPLHHGSYYIRKLPWNRRRPFIGLPVFLEWLFQCFEKIHNRPTCVIRSEMWIIAAVGIIRFRVRTSYHRRIFLAFGIDNAIAYGTIGRCFRSAFILSEHLITSGYRSSVWT